MLSIEKEYKEGCLLFVLKNYTQMEAYGYEWSWLLWNPASAKKIFKKVGGGGVSA